MGRDGEIIDRDKGIINSARSEKRRFQEHLWIILH